jgi:hypothetical protein
MPTLNYLAIGDEWTLFVPCRTCGGTELPLIAQISTDRLAESLTIVARELGTLGCPACHARHRRAASGDQPEVWYEPDLNDWVVRVPAAHGPGAILPLEIRWFDAPMTLVHRSAADIVYAGDALFDDEEPSEDVPTP